MTLYRVKFKHIVRETEKAVLVETWDGRNVWLPALVIRQDFRYVKGVAFFVPEWLNNEKKLNGKPHEPYHRPKKIEPVYNQEPLDDLKL